MDTVITEKTAYYAELEVGAPLPKLGEEFGGGCVSAIMGWSATQGAIIITSPQDGDLGEMVLDPNYRDEPGAKSFLDGLANTRALAVYSEPAKLALEYRAGGRADWHVPAHGVQTGILANTCPIWTLLPAFAEGGAYAYPAEDHWSSTQSQFGSGYAWVQYFGLGNSVRWGKGHRSRIRLVRIVLFNL